MWCVPSSSLEDAKAASKDSAISDDSTWSRPYPNEHKHEHELACLCVCHLRLRSLRLHISFLETSEESIREPMTG